ncbi:hypothetical protein GJ496_004205 [Pomphorhynchus laevis]|nr:hypothetical protein GJ496_004205 [Pomphorhynchus laevis]
MRRDFLNNSISNLEFSQRSPIISDSKSRRICSRASSSDSPLRICQIKLKQINRELAKNLNESKIQIRDLVNQVTDLQKENFNLNVRLTKSKRRWDAVKDGSMSFAHAVQNESRDISRMWANSVITGFRSVLETENQMFCTTDLNATVSNDSPIHDKTYSLENLIKASGTVLSNDDFKENRNCSSSNPVITDKQTLISIENSIDLKQSSDKFVPIPDRIDSPEKCTTNLSMDKDELVDKKSDVIVENESNSENRQIDDHKATNNVLKPIRKLRRTKVISYDESIPSLSDQLEIKKSYTKEKKQPVLSVKKSRKTKKLSEIADENVDQSGNLQGIERKRSNSAVSSKMEGQSREHADTNLAQSTDDNAERALIEDSALYSVRQRRRTTKVSYKEPTLNSKLRRDA